MKKSWIILSLVVIIVFQLSVMSSFQSVLTTSHTSGTRAVVVSKLNYISLRATIQIYPRIHPGANSVFVTFSNGSQLEITEKYSMQILLPKTGSINGEFTFGTFLSFTPLDSGEFAAISLSRNAPMDVDITPDVPDSFLQWYYEPFDSDMDVQDETDIYWLIVEGDATIAVSGYGAPI